MEFIKLNSSNTKIIKHINNNDKFIIYCKLYKCITKYKE